MKQRKYIFIFLLVIIAAVVGIWMIEIGKGGMPYIDQWTRDFVPKLDDTLVYEFFYMVTHFGSRGFLIPFVSITAILLIIFKQRLAALFFAGGTLLSHKLNGFIKELVGRERPGVLAGANAEGLSFPSGHAMISLVCYGMLAYFITKNITSKALILTVQIGFTLLIFLIGMSRYVINVHFLTDIIAGYFIGYLLLVLFIYLYELIKAKRGIAKSAEK